MEATRRRFESFLEWAVAAACIAALLGLGSVVVREMRRVNAVTPVIAREPTGAPPVPASVPPRVVSVPVLLLDNGNQVRVGESLGSVTARLGPQAERRAPLVDQTPNGERLTRFYDYAGTRFVLVFEPSGATDDMRIAAIYLQ